MECKYCEIWRAVRDKRIETMGSIEDLCAELLRGQMNYCPTCGKKL